MVDIQSATIEIRRGKKRKTKKPQHENIYGRPYYIAKQYRLNQELFKAHRLLLSTCCNTLRQSGQSHLPVSRSNQCQTTALVANIRHQCQCTLAT